MIRINAGGTITLPFEVSHLYWILSTGSAAYAPLQVFESYNNGRVNIDVVSLNPLALTGTNGWEIFSFSLSGKRLSCSIEYIADDAVNDYVHFFIAVPA